MDTPCAPILAASEDATPCAVNAQPSNTLSNTESGGERSQQHSERALLRLTATLSKTAADLTTALDLARSSGRTLRRSSITLDA